MEPVRTPGEFWGFWSPLWPSGLQTNAVQFEVRRNFDTFRLRQCLASSAVLPTVPRYHLDVSTPFFKSPPLLPALVPRWSRAGPVLVPDVSAGTAAFREDHTRAIHTHSLRPNDCASATATATATAAAAAAAAAEGPLPGAVAAAAAAAAEAVADRCYHYIAECYRIRPYSRGTHSGNDRDAGLSGLLYIGSMVRPEIVSL